MIVRDVPNYGAPLALYKGTMRSKPNKDQAPELRIEVVSAKINQPDAWIEARAYLADCLVELLRMKQTVSAGEKREP